ncbi:YncE family protein [Streptomyces sp. NPDC001817]|uniref:YncE family protein n=1 Tax=Streptomyces sp. NPDC001817 TaxID=3154398 RepID=UPI003325FA30
MKIPLHAAVVLCLGALVTMPGGTAAASPHPDHSTVDSLPECRQGIHEEGTYGHDSGLPRGKYAFVVNSDNPQGTNGSLVVLDRRTQQVIKTVSQGLGRLPDAVAVQCDGSTAYVANFASDSLSVVDTESGTVTATVPVGDQPAQVVLSPDGRYAYVVNTGEISTAGSISVLDTKTNRVVRTITAGFNPFRMALTADGRHAYVVTDNTVRLLDTRNGKTLATLGNPSSNGLLVGLALAPNGQRLYAVDSTSNHVLVIDARTFTFAHAPVALPGFGLAGNAAVSPDSSLLYVTELGSTDVAVVDTATDTAQPTTITVGRNPTNVAFTPGGGKAYVTSSLDDPKGLNIINTSQGRVTSQINVGSGPFDVALVDTDRPGQSKP